MSQLSPTILLVHGAFTDASIWVKVSAPLQSRGFRVLCPALPMRGLASDAAYVESVLANIAGPVVLVGHSYGGAVISCPLNGFEKIAALVYVAAFQPDTGETAGELNSRFQGSKLTPESLNVWPTPSGQDIYLKRERFKEVYAGDLDDEIATVMAAAQRPIDSSAIGAALEGVPLWKKIPSWAVVAKQDQSIPAETLRFMAQRARSIVTEVDASHAVPVSRSAEVLQTIMAAVSSAGSPP